MFAKLKSALDAFDAGMKKKTFLFFFVTGTVGYVPFIVYFSLGAFLPDFLYWAVFYLIVLPMFLGNV